MRAWLAAISIVCVPATFAAENNAVDFADEIQEAAKMEPCSTCGPSREAVIGDADGFAVYCWAKTERNIAGTSPLATGHLRIQGPVSVEGHPTPEEVSRRKRLKFLLKGISKWELTSHPRS